MEKREARFKKITPVYLTLFWAVQLVLGCYYTARGLPYYAVLGFCAWSIKFAVSGQFTSLTFC